MFLRSFSAPSKSLSATALLLMSSLTEVNAQDENENNGRPVLFFASLVVWLGAAYALNCTRLRYYQPCTAGQEETARFIANREQGTQTDVNEEVQELTMQNRV